MRLLPASGSKTRSQLFLLVALAAVLVAILWYRFGTVPAPAAPATTSSVPSPTTVPDGGGALPVPEGVRLQALEAPGDLSDPGRNPFAYGVRPPPPPPPRVEMPSVPRPVGPPPPPPGPPPIPLRLTGLTVMPDTHRTMVTLKDPSTSTIYQAFEGDVVDGRYRVVKVGIQSVVLSYLDGSGVRTIGLGG
jgi:hypothetical protein